MQGVTFPLVEAMQNPTNGEQFATRARATEEWNKIFVAKAKKGNVFKVRGFLIFNPTNGEQFTKWGAGQQRNE